MTTKQLTKLATRIATLKAAHRIVWIEGIDADQIKGKIAGKACYFVKAESLNADGGCWYYIIRWEQVEWICSCEATKPCKHEKALQAHINALVITQRQPTREEDRKPAPKTERVKVTVAGYTRNGWTSESRGWQEDTSRTPRVLSEAEETAAAYYRMSLQEF